MGRPELQVMLVDAGGVDHPVTDFAELQLDWSDEDLGWTVRVRLKWTGDDLDACLRVSLAVPSDDPWWLIPGAFYGENRPAENTRVFPRFAIGASSPDEHAAFVSDHWEFRADRAAVPASMVWAGADLGGVGVAVNPDESGLALGLPGVGIAHDEHSGTARVHLSFPYREGPVSYFGDARARPADVSTHGFRTGDLVDLSIRVFELGPDRHDYAPILKALRAESAPAAPSNPWVDVESAAELTADGLLTWHYDPDPGVLIETVGFDREVSGRDGAPVDRQAMHVGWISGIPWAYALLAHGHRVDNPAAVAAAARVIDFCTAELSPSGTFWGVWYRDTGWTQSWTPLNRGLHSRTLAEATLFLGRALRVHDDSTWERAWRSNLDAVVARQRDDGNLGTVHDAETGEVLSWQGSAGLTWVAALVEAADRGPRYLRAAERAGDYYRSFVDREFLHGAPEDVDLAPSSEDGYVAVMSYVALHRATGDSQWLDLARRAADWMLTFRYSWNVPFEAATLLGTYGFRTRGGDQASPSNQHLHAYGLVCTAELRELSESLRDPFYAEQADEALACFRQFVARSDGDFNAYRGMVSERYYQTQCFQPKGMLLTLSHAWSVGVLLLACEETLARS